MSRRRGPAEERARVELGEARLRPDPSRPGSWTVFVDDRPQSCVDLHDPTRLEFGYVRWLAAVADAVAPPGAPVPVLHLGGGGLTLPRYLAVTRPGGDQRVVERDAALTRLVRRVLPLPRGAAIRVRDGDARDTVATLAADRFRLVVGDVYRDGAVPPELTSVEFVAAVRRVLTPPGWYAVNLTDRPPLDLVRRQVATLRTGFGQVCLLAEPAVLRGRRPGNVVLVAGAEVAVDRLRAALAAHEPAGVQLRDPAATERFAAGARPVVSC